MTAPGGGLRDGGPAVLDVDTPQGPARAHVTVPDGADPVATLVLGHGAGGGVGSADLAAVAGVAVALGWRTVLVEQPWRVAGRRLAPAPARLDEAWLAVLGRLGLPAGQTAGGPGRSHLVVGGRSAGARVACRTASRLGARAVLALAFPLHPPGRPERSRAGELAAAGVPVLAVQGVRDPFGTPAEVGALGLAHVAVAAVDGDHALARRAAGNRGGAAVPGAVVPGVVEAVRRWLGGPASPGGQDRA